MTVKALSIAASTLPALAPLCESDAFLYAAA
jgi:hypothetical protein